MSLWTKTARSTLLIIAAGALLGLGMAALEPGGFNSASVTAYGALCSDCIAGWLVDLEETWRRT